MLDIRPIECLNEDAGLHDAFVRSIQAVIERKIGSLGTVSRLAAGKAYAAIRAVRPGYVEYVIGRLSTDYVSLYSDLHAEYRVSQHLPAVAIEPLVEYMRPRAGVARKIFMDASDRYAAAASKTLIGRTYRVFRPTIEKHIDSVLSDIFDEIEKLTVYEV